MEPLWNRIPVANGETASISGDRAVEHDGIWPTKVDDVPIPAYFWVPSSWGDTAEIG